MDMIFRAAAIYLILVLVFKIAGRRALLQMTSFDLILLLIISEATQQALLGSDFSVTGATLSIVTLIVMDMLFGKIKKYLPGAVEMIDGTAVVLVEHGVPMAEK
jgi:Predicted membrane protein